MHLSSLTLKGFKSFAAPTTLRLEPGVTCVVGPNGSGKSNVVDAIAWVLGEQGARSLRGGQMSDVIFAGSPGRAPLGRAEVTLVIDNADGALPIEHAEVSVSRLLYRTGESEYAINGSPCRLLDVQELLSDSGIGREMHVIVGQGQLDAVLQARPEDRRAYIEEAAGVLKHRKRKEKALRKLDAMQANLTRLTDLTAELRRQLTPLGKQAEVAKRASVIQSTHRDARLRLLADDLLIARGALDAEVRDEEALRVRQVAAERVAAEGTAAVTHLEAVLAASGPTVSRAQETFYRLSAMHERLRGLAQLATERHRLLDQPLETGVPGRDPDELDAEADRVAAEQAEVTGLLAADQQSLDAVVHQRLDREAALAEEERSLVAAARAAADRREGVARLAGEVGAQRSRVIAAEEEIGRLSVGLEAARDRAERSAHELDSLAATVGDLDQGELGLDERHESAATQLSRAEGRLAELDDQQRAAERDRAQSSARAEALSLSLARRDGAGALLEAGLPGVLGTTAALLQVEPGMQAAVAAALGAVADAVVVSGVEAAAAALAHLRRTEAGRAGILVTGANPAMGGDAPGGARWAADVVSGPVAVVAAVRSCLAGVVIVDDLDAARQVAADGLSAVTRAGDLLGPGWSHGGSASAPSLLEVQAAHDEAVEAAETAQTVLSDLGAALEVAREARAVAATAVTDALELLHDNDARIAAVQERLGLLGSQARAAAGEAERLERSRREAETARDAALQGLAELEQRLVLAESTDVGPDEPGELAGERDRLSGEVAAIRAEEVERRLAVRTGEERVKALADRVSGLRRAAQAEREGRDRLARVRRQRERGARVAAAVAEVAADALRLVEAAVEEAAGARQLAQQERTVREAELLDARASLRVATTELDGLRDVLHRDEVLRTEQRLRIEALEEKVALDWGVTPEDLVGDYGPETPVPGEPGEDGEPGPPTSFDRAGQERRAAAAERQLTLLGKVNPLALEEFEALQERHAFLATQLEDLRTTRKDLLGIVDDVDARIHDVFKEAFEDTAREFQLVFATLFPGGEGRLVLTEPDDLMITGVEVEARPAGKKVKRLSLLSGGERSLAAIALLLAIFRARPSPFYVLDEVEAALDDTNLGRLLDAFALLRERSQLVVITHQKRTMEIADALYGVTMRGDGVTTVVSQRLREHATA